MLVDGTTTLPSSLMQRETRMFVVKSTLLTVFRWGAAAAAATPAAAPAKSEDDFDLFGEDDEQYDEVSELLKYLNSLCQAYEAEVERRAKEQAEKKAKAGKVVVLKSAVVIDVKPWESDTGN